MDIRQVFTIVNQMQLDGTISDYAIGEAVGATFYLEPVATLDVDIFITFRAEPGQLLLNPQPIFDYLTARGCTMQGEYVVIAGWPVQFLPPPSPLVEEALGHAVTVDVEGTPARVFTAEYLAAIALQTGRAKDKARLLQFVEEGRLDPALLQKILGSHQLDGAWQKFQRQFLDNAP